MLINCSGIYNNVFVFNYLASPPFAWFSPHFRDFSFPTLPLVIFFKYYKEIHLSHSKGLTSNDLNMKMEISFRITGEQIRCVKSAELSCLIWQGILCYTTSNTM